MARNSCSAIDEVDDRKPAQKGKTMRHFSILMRPMRFQLAVLVLAVFALINPVWNGWAQTTTPETSATNLSPTSATSYAKSVIQIWMWGGPSQLDTFDPKPAAGYDYTGPLDKPIDTDVPGIQIGQLLPLTAKEADKYAIIRSMTHGINAHETAAYMMQTGHMPGPVVYPSLGAIVSYFKGYDFGYKGKIPPYVVLTESQGRFAEEGFLGPKYKPFITGGDPSKTPFLVDGIVAEGVTDKQQEERRTLLHELDTLDAAMPGNADFTAAAKYENEAYDMILGNARKVFDLSTESDQIRDHYGRTWFGQACLEARKLVEAGVPYITINYKGWDTHKQHFQAMQKQMPELDKGLSALLQDLSDRGLLDTTIVWWGGEFGRTPKVFWEAPWNGGRSHWGNAFSVVLAGGGFEGGKVVGATDSKAENVVQRPVYPQDLIGSILTRLGIDLNARLPNPFGEDLRVLPGITSKPGVGLLYEIMQGGGK
jgi:hypothetical protein